MDEPAENPVPASIGPVVEHARWVFFHPEHLDSAVHRWGHLLSERSAWEHPCHYFDGTEETVRWIFVLDVLNHCFWPDRGEPVWTVTHGGETWSGYWGLAASLKRAMEEGAPLTDAGFLARLRPEDLSRILAGEGLVPLFADRLANLREAGRVLDSEWGGDVVNLIEAAKGNAIRAVRKVVSSFASFRDEASHAGMPVYFWKRAQIFVSDLHAAFQGSRWGTFDDIARLTAFADYKLPQVLRELGVISYHPGLARRIDGLAYLASGSEEEIEIRAMTIHAVEELKKAFARTGKPVSAAAVDNWLWQLGQSDGFRRRPYHRCRTIFY
jgi:hypothetical protein